MSAELTIAISVMTRSPWRIGRVPASQTYLDIGQGNRLAPSLYPEVVPPLYITGNRVPGVTRSFHLSDSGSSRAVAFGSHGSTLSADPR